MGTIAGGPGKGCGHVIRKEFGCRFGNMFGRKPGKGFECVTGKVCGWRGSSKGLDSVTIGLIIGKLIGGGFWCEANGFCSGCTG